MRRDSVLARSADRRPFGCGTRGGERRSDREHCCDNRATSEGRQRRGLGKAPRCDRRVAAADECRPGHGLAVPTASRPRFSLPARRRCCCGPGDTASHVSTSCRLSTESSTGSRTWRVWRSRSARLLNTRRALEFAHDKLRTAASLVTARLPHPKTVHLPHADAPLGLAPPFVLKPRYGSWGLDSSSARRRTPSRRCSTRFAPGPGSVRHGALIQELVPFGARRQIPRRRRARRGGGPASRRRRASGGRTSRSVRRESL